MEGFVGQGSFDHGPIVSTFGSLHARGAFSRETLTPAFFTPPLKRLSFAIPLKINVDILAGVQGRSNHVKD